MWHLSGDEISMGSPDSCVCAKFISQKFHFYITKIPFLFSTSNISSPLHWTTPSKYLENRTPSISFLQQTLHFRWWSNNMKIQFLCLLFIIFCLITQPSSDMFVCVCACVYVLGAEWGTFIFHPQQRCSLFTPFIQQKRHKKLSLFHCTMGDGWSPLRQFTFEDAQIEYFWKFIDEFYNLKFDVFPVKAIKVLNLILFIFEFRLNEPQKRFTGITFPFEKFSSFFFSGYFDDFHVSSIDIFTPFICCCPASHQYTHTHTHLPFIFIFISKLFLFHFYF